MLANSISLINLIPFLIAFFFISVFFDIPGLTTIIFESYFFCECPPSSYLYSVSNNSGINFLESLINTSKPTCLANFAAAIPLLP